MARLLFVVALSISAPVVAHADDPQEGDFTLPPIVVTASRTEQLESDAVVATEVISREQLEDSGAQDAGEVLEEQAGVFVSRTFRGAGLQMQGLDPEYTLVLVDGERVPGRTGGVIDLDRYPIEMIERIEVVRGPNSALYGSDAIGGVINIVTRKAKRPISGEALTSAGISESGSAVIDATVSGGLASDEAQGRASAGHHRADAFDRDASDDATTGSAFEQWDLALQGSYEPLHGLTLDARADYTRRELEGVDGSASGAVFDRTQITEQAQGSFGTVLRAGGIAVRSRASFAVYRDQFLSDQRRSNVLDDYQDNEERLGQITTQLEGVAGDHFLTGGVEQLFQSLSSDRLDRDGDRYRLAFFAQDEWMPIDGDVALVVVPGVRADFDSQFGNRLSPKLALRFDPIPDVLVVRASYGLGFRAPSFQELLLRFENSAAGYVVRGNPDLDAETSRGVNVGVEWRAAPGFRLSVEGYRNDLSQMITAATVRAATVSSPMELAYVNVASAYTQGFDVRARVEPVDELSIDVGYSFLHTRDEVTERPLEGKPAHRLTATVNVEIEPIDTRVVVRSALISARTYFTSVGDETRREDDAAFLQTDVRVVQPLMSGARPSGERGSSIEAFAFVENLFDAGDDRFVVRPRTFGVGAVGRY